MKSISIAEVRFFKTYSAELSPNSKSAAFRLENSVFSRLGGDKPNNESLADARVAALSGLSAGDGSVDSLFLPALLCQLSEDSALHLREFAKLIGVESLIGAFIAEKCALTQIFAAEMLLLVKSARPKYAKAILSAFDQKGFLRSLGGEARDVSATSVG